MVKMKEAGVNESVARGELQVRLNMLFSDLPLRING